jgi:hypothetical protein
MGSCSLELYTPVGAGEFHDGNGCKVRASNAARGSNSLLADPARLGNMRKAIGFTVTLNGAWAATARSDKMRKLVSVLCVASFVLTIVNANVRAAGERTKSFRLDSLEGLEIVNSKAEIVTYRGRRALHLAPAQDHETDKHSMIALRSGTDFKDGTIEVEVAGLPMVAMDPTARGFVGVVFHAQEHGARAENIYLRPTNGRADDQLRRNHSVQYESLPDFPWHRLREEAPGVYESYADLEAGAWTKMKIEVAGTTARLYVNGSEQPCLLVNDLKLGDARGQIGLWAYIATDAYFSNLKVTQTN